MSKTQGITDAKLVLEYQSGNPKALSILVKRWHKEFCNRSYWVVKDADVAKDIAQESWKTIIANINALKNPKSFRSWALRIVYTKSIDHTKILAKERLQKENIYYEKNTIVEEKQEKTELKQELLKAIKMLPEHQQIALRLFYVEAYSLNEMSDILNISVGTAKSRIFHAREKLKTILKQKYYEN